MALFADSFYELNGVATVSRQFQAYSERRGLPFCSVHAGPHTCTVQAGSVTRIELKRGPSFPLDKDLYCDPFLNRYRNRVWKQMQAFRPDLIHITGPGDMGILGFWISHLMGVPLAASWHTNLHEYLSRRVERYLRLLPRAIREPIAGSAEHQALRALLAFYRLAHFVIAPNQGTVDLLAERTGRPAYLMQHGVDTALFSPARRCKATPDFCIGWVGRLTPEKNVRAFADLEQQLTKAGERDFGFLLVGDGSERGWLKKHLPQARMPGFLRGEELARAFANMDAFVFPSHTDTFGLVILEALASGVPVVLSSEAGARVGIRDGVEGWLSDNYAEGVHKLIHCQATRESMSSAARTLAKSQSWNSVFDNLHETYATALCTTAVRRRMKIVNV